MEWSQSGAAFLDLDVNKPGPRQSSPTKKPHSCSLALASLLFIACIPFILFVFRSIAKDTFAPARIALKLALAFQRSGLLGVREPCLCVDVRAYSLRNRNPKYTSDQVRVVLEFCTSSSPCAPSVTRQSYHPAASPRIYLTTITHHRISTAESTMQLELI